jgi:hypothetical protein
LKLREECGSERGIQVRADNFKGDRPECPRGCSGGLHRHGFYSRFCKPTGTECFRVQRFLCVSCGHTVSVLPGGRLTYRPLEVERLEGFFDTQAEIRTGLDPPPGLVEAGCLQRAWNRLLARVHILKDAFGQLLPSELPTAPALWKALRRGLGSAEQMLRFLAQSCKRSLLGDYTCLRPAP